MYSVVKGFRWSASGTVGLSITRGRGSRAKNGVSLTQPVKFLEKLNGKQFLYIYYFGK